MKYLAYTWLLLGLGACGNSDGQSAAHLTFNDFDTLAGWTGSPNPSLTKEKAHSGKYSIKVDPSLEYSLGYNSTLNRLSDARADAKNMAIRGWAFVPSESDHPQVVLELLNPATGQLLLREAADLHQVAADQGYGKWVEFSHPVALPAAATAFTQVKLYLWRGDSPEPVYVDDLALDKAR